MRLWLQNVTTSHYVYMCATPSSNPHPTGDLIDIFSYDPGTMAWTLLSSSEDGSRPRFRSSSGFASLSGTLFLHGGIDITGKLGGECI